MTHSYFFLVGGKATPALAYSTRGALSVCSSSSIYTSRHRVGCVPVALIGRRLCAGPSVELLVRRKPCNALSLTFQSSCGKKAGRLLRPGRTGPDPLSLEAS